jgi:hypothetical protein
MIEGALESVDKEQIRGWAYVADDREDRLLVEVFVRGRLRASLWADEAPPVAASSVIGAAGHGFLVGFSRPLADEDLPGVEVYATAKSGERVRLGPGGVRREGRGAIAPGLGSAPGPAGADEPRRWPFPAPQISPPPPGQLRLEVAAAIDRLGTRHFSGSFWARSRGAAFPIRGVAVRAIGPQPPTAIAVRGFSAGGRETAWIAGGEFCAPEDGEGPLTGFAVRAADRRYEALYHGRFAAGGEIGPCRDGEPCTSTSPDDPLTAIRVEIRERARQS